MQRLQEDRRRERERARRMQLTRRYGIIGGGVLVVLILALVIAHFATAASGSPQAASGNAVDGITCVPAEGQVQHFHDQLYVFVGGQPVTVPAGVGIVQAQQCLYSLHTHDTSGIMHIESDSATQKYYLGNFFDIWGQPLTSTNFMGNKIDATHKFEVRVYDANGVAGTYTGVPAKLPLSPHLTIFLLYDSPYVHTAPFTAWNGL
jgi:hypothetical protein